MDKPLKSVTHGQCDARPTVTFPVAGHRCPATGTKLYCLMTEAYACEQLAQAKRLRWELNSRPLESQANALTMTPLHHQACLCMKFEDSDPVTTEIWRNIQNTKHGTVICGDFGHSMSSCVSPSIRTHSTSHLLFVENLHRFQDTANSLSKAANSSYLACIWHPSHQLTVPPHRRTTYGGRAFAVAGASTWNSLAKRLRDPSSSFAVFARLLKTFLFSGQSF